MKVVPKRGTISWHILALTFIGGISASFLAGGFSGTSSWFLTL